MDAQQRPKHAHRYAINAVHRTNDGDARLQLAKNGYGLTQFPDWLVQDDLVRGNLVQVLSGFTPEPQPIYVLWQKKLHLQPKVKVVVGCLGEGG